MIIIEKSLDEVKRDKIAQLLAEYKKAINADIEYMNTVFQADEESQATMMKVLLGSGGTLPDGFYWLDKYNNKVAMTYADLQGLANVLLLRGQQAFDKLQTLKAQVLQATTKEEVEGISW